MILKKLVSRIFIQSIIILNVSLIFDPNFIAKFRNNLKFMLHVNKPKNCEIQVYIWLF